MSNDVLEILAELRQDHKNMALLLNLLERESNRIYEGDDPDFDVLHDVMQYMTVYPDAVHHPKEDRLYAEVRSVRPDLASGFDRITTHLGVTAGRLVSLRLEILGGFLALAVWPSDLNAFRDVRPEVPWTDAGETSRKAGS